MNALTLAPCPTERRRMDRYRDADGFLRLTVFLGNPHSQAFVRDVSLAGLGIVISHPLEAGEIVSIELYHPLQKCWYLKLLRVVHVTPQDDGTWYVGGTFSRSLAEQEVRELLPGSLFPSVLAEPCLCGGP